VHDWFHHEEQLLVTKCVRKNTVRAHGIFHKADPSSHKNKRIVVLTGNHWTWSIPNQRRNERGRGHNFPSAKSLWGRRMPPGRRITAGGAEESQKFHKHFLQYSKFASERAQVQPWDPKLASCPGRHLTSLRPCT